MNINGRVFGSDIPVPVKKKLEARQYAATKDKSPNEQVDSIYPPYTDFTYGDLLNNELNGAAELSSRTPFARLWTAVELRDKVDYEGDEAFTQFSRKVPYDEAKSDYENREAAYQLARLASLGDPDNPLKGASEFGGKLYPRVVVIQDDDGNYWIKQKKSNAVKGVKKVYQLNTNNVGEESTGTDIYNQIGKKKGDSLTSEQEAQVKKSSLFPDEHNVVDDHNKFMKPAAGITSVKCSTEGQLGIIKKTEVTFQVHNFADYEEIYMTYFMRPGAQLFLDFGWSNVDLYDPNDLVTNVAGSEERLQYLLFDHKIGVVALNQGDLETITGLVTNYSSRILPDGGVECNVTMTSKNSALLGTEVKQENQLKIEFLIDNIIQFEELYKYQNEKERDLLRVSLPDENTEPENVEAFQNRINELASLAFGNSTLIPGDTATTSGVYTYVVDGTTYMSWGLLEDRIFNSEFGFGRDVETMNHRNLKDKQNFEITLDSSESYTKWETKIDEMQAAIGRSAEENPPTMLVPGNWGISELDGEHLEKNAVAYAGGESDFTGTYDAKWHSVRTYNTMNGKRPEYEVLVDRIAKETQEGKQYARIGLNSAFGGLNPSFTRIDEENNRIPIREMFIRTDEVISAFNNHDTCKGAIEALLAKINEESLDYYHWRLVGAPGDDSSLSVIDYNFVGILNEVGADTAHPAKKASLEKKFDKLFVFDVTGPGSMVQNFDMELALPSGNIGNMLAIQGLNSANKSISIDSTFDDNLTISSLLQSIKDEDHYITYLPEISSMRVSQILDTANKQGMLYNMYGNSEVWEEPVVSTEAYSGVTIDESADTGLIYQKPDIPEPPPPPDPNVLDAELQAAISSSAGKTWIKENKEWQSDFSHDFSEYTDQYGYEWDMDDEFKDFTSKKLDKKWKKFSWTTNKATSNFFNQLPLNDTVQDHFIKADEEEKHEQGYMITNNMKDYFKKRLANDFFNESNSSGKSIPFNYLTLKLSLYGIASLNVGDCFRVNHLPKVYLDTMYFQIIKIEHELSPSGWITNLETQFRIRPDKKDAAGIKQKPLDVFISSTTIKGLGLTTFPRTSKTSNDMWSRPRNIRRKQREALLRDLRGFASELQPYIPEWMVHDPYCKVAYGYSFRVNKNIKHVGPGKLQGFGLTVESNGMQQDRFEFGQPASVTRNRHQKAKFDLTEYTPMIPIPFQAEAEYFGPYGGDHKWSISHDKLAMQTLMSGGHGQFISIGSGPNGQYTQADRQRDEQYRLRAVQNAYSQTMTSQMAMIDKYQDPNKCLANYKKMQNLWINPTSIIHSEDGIYPIDIQKQRQLRTVSNSLEGYNYTQKSDLLKFGRRRRYEPVEADAYCPPTLLHRMKDTTSHVSDFRNWNFPAYDINVGVDVRNISNGGPGVYEPTPADLAAIDSELISSTITQDMPEDKPLYPMGYWIKHSGYGFAQTLNPGYHTRGIAGGHIQTTMFSDGDHHGDQAYERSRIGTSERDFTDNPDAMMEWRDRQDKLMFNAYSKYSYHHQGIYNSKGTVFPGQEGYYKFYENLGYGGLPPQQNFHHGSMTDRSIEGDYSWSDVIARWPLIMQGARLGYCGKLTDYSFEGLQPGEAAIAEKTYDKWNMFDQDYDFYGNFAYRNNIDLEEDSDYLQLTENWENDGMSDMHKEYSKMMLQIRSNDAFYLDGVITNVRGMNPLYMFDSRKNGSLINYMKSYSNATGREWGDDYEDLINNDSNTLHTLDQIAKPPKYRKEFPLVHRYMSPLIEGRYYVILFNTADPTGHWVIIDREELEADGGDAAKYPFMNIGQKDLTWMDEDYELEAKYKRTQLLSKIAPTQWNFETGRPESGLLASTFTDDELHEAQSSYGQMTDVNDVQDLERRLLNGESVKGLKLNPDIIELRDNWQHYWEGSGTGWLDSPNYPTEYGRGGDGYNIVAGDSAPSLLEKIKYTFTGERVSFMITGHTTKFDESEENGGMGDRLYEHWYYMNYPMAKMASLEYANQKNMGHVGQFQYKENHFYPGTNPVIDDFLEDTSQWGIESHPQYTGTSTFQASEYMNPFAPGSIPMTGPPIIGYDQNYNQVWDISGHTGDISGWSQYYGFPQLENGSQINYFSSGGAGYEDLINQGVDMKGMGKWNPYQRWERYISDAGLRGNEGILHSWRYSTNQYGKSWVLDNRPLSGVHPHPIDWCEPKIRDTFNIVGDTKWYDKIKY